MGNDSSAADNDALQRFSKALDSMRVNQEQEKQLELAVRECMKTLEAIAQELASRSGGDLEADAKDPALSISANGRNLTFIPTKTIAMDSHLHHARCMLAAQVLVFGHADEEKGSGLISGFRVYADGVCTDGERKWHRDNSDGDFLSYLVDLLIETLLVPEICWPANENLSEQIRILPLSAGKADAEKLHEACIGFECALPRQAGKQSS